MWNAWLMLGLTLLSKSGLCRATGVKPMAKYEITTTCYSQNKQHEDRCISSGLFGVSICVSHRTVSFGNNTLQADACHRLPQLNKSQRQNVNIYTAGGSSTWDHHLSSGCNASLIARYVILSLREQNKVRAVYLCKKSPYFFQGMERKTSNYLIQTQSCANYFHFCPPDGM